MKESTRVNVTVMQDEKGRTGHCCGGKMENVSSFQEAEKGKRTTLTDSTKEPSPSDRRF